MQNTYDNADLLFHGVLDNIVSRGMPVPPVIDGTSIGSHFGAARRPTKELLAEVATLSAPKRRLVVSRGRSMNLGFAIANFFWTLRGTDDPTAIQFYSTNARVFLADSGVLEGAIGRRIDARHAGGQAQIARVVEVLRQDPTSRRAVVQIFDSSDTGAGRRDTPCSLSLQYLVRDSRLVAITFMRSQSAYGVLPYDLFLFTMLQELIAGAIGVALGPYHHVCGSLHFYDDEVSRVEAVLAETVIGGDEMPAMPVDSMQLLEEILAGEEVVRSCLATGRSSEYQKQIGHLAPYWQNMFQALAVDWRRRHGDRPTTEEKASMVPVYQEHMR